ncbi:MAG: hypothetical protein QT11_C0001G0633 [archaeon GW2011_AR20]|nr:MAG: hypothetical protein QT11_C0001G0633 [archaeon GW2011_AR20]MBS3160904.1 hypothetical protein [Candidatus Woesearchaeota archaeon]
MEKNTIIAVALGILVLISIVQAIQIVSLKNRVVDSIIGSVVGDEASETYEAMMARMHPDQYQASNLIASQSGPTMVGGC